MPFMYGHRYSTMICRFSCHLHITCRRYSTTLAGFHAIYMLCVADIVPLFASSHAIYLFVVTFCRSSTVICRFSCLLHITCRRYSTICQFSYNIFYSHSNPLLPTFPIFPLSCPTIGVFFFTKPLLNMFGSLEKLVGTQPLVHKSLGIVRRILLSHPCMKSRLLSFPNISSW